MIRPSRGARRPVRGGARVPDGGVRAGRATALFCALALGGAASGCIERGYPLGSGGNVDIRLDTAGDLFAADAIGDDGKPVEPRQSPYSTGVTLTLSEGSEAANGGFVDVRVEPADALVLTSDPAEDSTAPTCKEKDGVFRCTATPEGVARFFLASESTWSGEAVVVVTWADQRKEVSVDVLPAGLPPTATSFELIASDLSDSEHVLPSFTALACTTIDTLPGELGSKWRPGNIRSREAYVRATPPASAPGVVANAPVVIESLSSEGALSLDPACSIEDRRTRLRVLLDSTGASPRFHVCFSDIGGAVDLSVSSGLLAVSPPPSFKVDPEPRVLRVAALGEKLLLNEVAELFEITAFNADLERIAMDVDLQSSNPDILQLLQASDTLAGDGVEPTRLIATGAGVGSASLHVRPRLFSQPDCESVPITVSVLP